MGVRDYNADNSELDEQPAPTRNEALRWDGWGEPSTVSQEAQQRGELAREGAETTDAQPATRSETVWDGWGDRPNEQRELADIPGKSPPVDRGDFANPDLIEQPAVQPSTDAWRSPSERSEEAAHARTAIDAAFQESSDMPTDSGGTSKFKESVERSEAQQVESLSEAEDYARDAIGVQRVDFSDFDQKTANEVNATLEVLRDKYPEVGGLEYLGTIQGRNADISVERPDLATDLQDVLANPDPSVIAEALRNTQGYNGITFNSESTSSYDQVTSDAQEREAKGWSAEKTGSVAGVTAHEFGHLVEYHLVSTGQFTAELQDALDGVWAQGTDTVSREVSQYGAIGDNPSPDDRIQHELFAELFAEYQLNSEPRDAALRVGHLIDDILGS